MIIYNVTISVDEDIAAEWLQWMQEVHIPAVMETGMFFENHILQVLAEEDTGKTYSVQYLCSDMATYQMYESLFAPSLQAVHALRYANKFVAFRTLLDVIK